MFINEKLTFFIGRQAEFQKLVNFIEKDQRVNDHQKTEGRLGELSLDDAADSLKAKIRNQNSVIVTGPEGCGSKERVVELLL